ncbi:MAG: gluconokinase [Flavobacteriaceae bacterium]|nr:gluconokinase [Flavobacteriaceae bacterium]
MSKTIIVMGVSGSGKTTLGEKLSRLLGISFVEGDQFHSPMNIKKMKDGIPLDDEDRAPWLHDLNKRLIQEKNTGVVLACSALKQSYRDVLSRNIHSDQLLWVYLACDLKTLKKRMENRIHFMPISLLESQLETLEVPVEGIHLDANTELNDLVNQIKSHLNHA